MRVVLSSGGHDVVFTGGGGQYVLVVVYGGGLWVVMVQGQSGTRVSAVAHKGRHVGPTGDGEGGCRGRRVSDVVVDEGSGRLRIVSICCATGTEEDWDLPGSTSRRPWSQPWCRWCWHQSPWRGRGR